MTLTRTNWPDVDEVIALNADTESMRDLGDHPPMTPARVLAEEMPRLMADNRRPDRLGSWVARDRETGSFLGWFMIKPVDGPLRTVELTYRLRRRVWGRGYDLEGVLGMIQLARAAQVSTVIATLPAIDITSHRLMENAGMRIVRNLVGAKGEPTTAAIPRHIDYALDLTMDATPNQMMKALATS